MVMYPVVLILLLVTLLQGTTIDGANASRWIRVPFVGFTFQTSTLAALVLMVFVLSLISGSFPAFILSAFRPVSVLKGSNILIGKDGKQLISGGRLRKFLVTLQYFVAIGMIISTLIIAQQIAFIDSQDLGFEKENLLVIDHINQLKKNVSSIKINLILGSLIFLLI